MTTPQEPHWEGTGTNTAAASRACAGDPSVESPGMVPSALEMLVEIPLLIPPRKDLILPTHPGTMPEVIPQVAMWVISGRDTMTVRFWRRLQGSSWHDRGRSPQVI